MRTADETAAAGTRGKGLVFRIVGAGVTGLVSTLVAAWNLRLWDADPRVPIFGLTGDSTLTHAVSKGIIDHGWLWSNPDIGAPDGMKYFDWPAGFGDSGLGFMIWLLGRVSDDPPLVVNAVYLVGFFLAGAISFLVIRAFGIGTAVAFVGGLLFALLPGHFMREVSHLGLSSYYAVPVSCLLILGTAGIGTLFARRPQANGIASWLSWRSAWTLLLAVFVAISGLYYALFTLVLLLLVAFFYFLARRDRSLLLQAAAVSAVVAAFVVVQQLPAVIYAQENGRNEVVSVRNPGESELYGLKLAKLLLPRPDHRLPSFAAVGQEYVNSTSDQGEQYYANIGTGLGIMFVVLVGVVFFKAAGGWSRAGPFRDLLAASGIATLLGVLVATLGGGGAIFAFLVSPQIRAWNRISVFLAFFAVVALAVLLTKAGRWLKAHDAPRSLSIVGLLAVAVFGVLDQTSSPKIDYPGILDDWRAQARFVREIDNRMPPGAMILELPYVPFPENPPVNKMSDYELFTPYIHDKKGLKWSYGEIKGRPEDWGDNLDRFGSKELVTAAALAGFSGIYIDRDGYADDGRKVVRRIRRVVGPEQQIQQSDGRAVFFDLTAYRAELDAEVTPQERAAVRDTLYNPVAVAPGPGFSVFENYEGIQRAWGDLNGEVIVENPAGKKTKATLRVAYAGPSSTQKTRVTLQCPGAPSGSVSVDSVNAGKLSLKVTVPASGLACRSTADGPAGPVTSADPRPKYQLLIAPKLDTPGLGVLERLSRR